MEKDSPCKWKPKLEGNRIMIKGSIQQEDIFINIYATKVVAPKALEQIAIQRGKKGTENDRQ